VGGGRADECGAVLVLSSNTHSYSPNASLPSVLSLSLSLSHALSLSPTHTHTHTHTLASLDPNSPPTHLATHLAQSFDQIGQDGGEAAPLTLDRFMSYDEMQLAALLIVTTPTFFINAGGRNNQARPATAGTFERRGVYAAMVGSRFERPERMESRHVLVTASQNTAAKGYGGGGDGCEADARRALLQAWAQFYGRDHFPCFGDGPVAGEEEKVVSWWGRGGEVARVGDAWDTRVECEHYDDTCTPLQVGVHLRMHTSPSPSLYSAPVSLLCTPRPITLTPPQYCSRYPRSTPDPLTPTPPNPTSPSSHPPPAPLSPYTTGTARSRAGTWTWGCTVGACGWGPRRFS
jgi:hypothetical protein